MRNGARHVLFKDRKQAGELLAERLVAYRATPALVLGLARGGMVPANTVAIALHVASDVLVVQKLPSPGNREYAIGAIAPDNVSVIRRKEAHRLGVDDASLETAVRELSATVKQKSAEYRKGHRPVSVGGKIVILVDDGAATGATMEAAILWARRKGARRIVVALPVASKEAAALLRPEADDVVIVHEEQSLVSVGAQYESFAQVTDEDVIELVG